MKTRILILFCIISAIVGYAGFESYIIQNKFTGNGNEISFSPKSLPEIEIPYLNESMGSFSIKSLHGKLVIVHFWATWCAPCEREFPELSKLSEHFKDNDYIILLLIAVNDSDNAVRKFLKKYPFNSKNTVFLLDNKDVFKNYFGSYQLPETYLFSKNGQFIRKLAGVQLWNSIEMRDYLLTQSNKIQ